MPKWGMQTIISIILLPCVLDGVASAERYRTSGCRSQTRSSTWRAPHRLEGRLKPFEEVQAEIEKELLDERRTRRYAELIDRLQREHHVEMLL